MTSNDLDWPLTYEAQKKNIEKQTTYGSVGCPKYDIESATAMKITVTSNDEIPVSKIWRSSRIRFEARIVTTI